MAHMGEDQERPPAGGKRLNKTILVKKISPINDRGRKKKKKRKKKPEVP